MSIFKRCARHKRAVFFSLFLFVITGIGVFGFWNNVYAADGGVMGTLANTVVGVVGWLVKIILGLLMSLINMLIYIIMAVAQYNGFIYSVAVSNGWSVVRDLCNMFFVLVLLAIAAGTILQQEKYHYSKTLPHFILMAILINFSKTICGLLIDLGQVVMMTFVGAIQSAGPGNFISIVGIGGFTSMSEGTTVADAVGTLVSLILAVLLAFITLVVMAVIAIQLIIRIVAIWFLVTLSPFAFFLSSFPQGAEYAKMWWKEFTNYVIVGPVMLFFLWLSLSVSQGTNEGKKDVKEVQIHKQLGDITWGAAKGIHAGESIAGTTPGLAGFILGIVMLLAPVVVAQKIGGVGSGIASSGMGMIKNAATGTAKAPFKLAGGAVRGAYNKSKEGLKKAGTGALNLAKTPFQGGKKPALAGKPPLISPPSGGGPAGAGGPAGGGGPGGGGAGGGSGSGGAGRSAGATLGKGISKVGAAASGAIMKAGASTGPAAVITAPLAAVAAGAVRAGSAVAGGAVMVGSKVAAGAKQAGTAVAGGAVKTARAVGTGAVRAGATLAKTDWGALGKAGKKGAGNKLQAGMKAARTGAGAVGERAQAVGKKVGDIANTDVGALAKRGTQAAGGFLKEDFEKTKAHGAAGLAAGKEGAQAVGKKVGDIANTDVGALAGKGAQRVGEAVKGTETYKKAEKIAGETEGLFGFTKQSGDAMKPQSTQEPPMASTSGGAAQSQPISGGGGQTQTPSADGVKQMTAPGGKVKTDEYLKGFYERNPAWKELKEQNDIKKGAPMASTSGGAAQSQPISGGGGQTSASSAQKPVETKPTIQGTEEKKPVQSKPGTGFDSSGFHAEQDAQKAEEKRAPSPEEKAARSKLYRETEQNKQRYDVAKLENDLRGEQENQGRIQKGRKQAESALSSSMSAPQTPFQKPPLTPYQQAEARKGVNMPFGPTPTSYPPQAPKEQGFATGPGQSAATTREGVAGSSVGTGGRQAKESMAVESSPATVKVEAQTLATSERPSRAESTQTPVTQKEALASTPGSAEGGKGSPSRAPEAAVGASGAIAAGSAAALASSGKTEKSTQAGSTVVQQNVQQVTEVKQVKGQVDAETKASLEKIKRQQKEIIRTVGDLAQEEKRKDTPPSPPPSKSV